MSDLTTLKVAIVGGVDAGKSSLIGVLTHDILDDGRGSARLKILKSKHERESGRTSNVSYNYIKYSSTDAKTSSDELISDVDREITMIDLAGHEKYLKTTLFGITGHFIDYALVIVGSNMGVNRMTKEHMSILLWLNIPFVVLLTKEDICPPTIYTEHKQKLRRLLKIPLFHKKSVTIDSDEDFEAFFNNCTDENYFNTNIPIITTSCKTGKNIDKIHTMFKTLPTKHISMSDTNIPAPIKNVSIISYIECAYNVKGVGLVITGSLGNKCTPLETGATLYIGPFGDEKIYMIQVRVKSLHGNFYNLVPNIQPGQSFCANVRGIDATLVKNQIRKGLIVTSDRSLVNKMSKTFIAKIKILNLKTTIGIGYTPVIHYRTVRQAARIIHIDIPNVDDSSVIRGDQDAIVKFQFLAKPEYIEQDAQLFFRDGITKGVGKILAIAN